MARIGFRSTAWRTARSGFDQIDAAPAARRFVGPDLAQRSIPGLARWDVARSLLGDVDGLDPVGDLVDAVVVGEGGDDGACAGGWGLGPGGPAVGDDDDGVWCGFGGGGDAVGHVGAACTGEGDVVGVVYVLVVS